MNEESFFNFLKSLDAALQPHGEVLIEAQDGAITIQMESGPCVLLDYLDGETTMVSAPAGTCHPIEDEQSLVQMGEAAGDWFRCFGVSLGVIPEMGVAIISRSWPDAMLEHDVARAARDIEILCAATKVWKFFLDDRCITAAENAPAPKLMPPVYLEEVPVGDEVDTLTRLFSANGFAHEIDRIDASHSRIVLSPEAPPLDVIKVRDDLVFSIGIPLEHLGLSRAEAARHALVNNFSFLGTEGETFAIERGTGSVLAMSRCPASEVAANTAGLTGDLARFCHAVFSHFQFLPDSMMAESETFFSHLDASASGWIPI